MVIPSNQSSAVPPPVVHIVEDDDDVRMATARMLRLAGYTVQMHASAAEFLGRPASSSAGCVILDIELPDLSGLDLQRLLTRTAEVLPVVFVTGHGDIATGVRAIKTGAVDFLTKPVAKDALLAAVDQALTLATNELNARERTRAVRLRYERLTPREREVFAHVISGQLNKQVAYDLGAAERTIKAHRHSIMVKLEAESVADLIAIAQELRIPPRRDTR